MSGLWERIRGDNAKGLSHSMDYTTRPDINTHVNLREHLDKEVSADEVINVEAVVEDILSHPHRKQFRKLDLPNAESMWLQTES